MVALYIRHLLVWRFGSWIEASYGVPHYQGSMHWQNRIHTVDTLHVRRCRSFCSCGVEMDIKSGERISMPCSADFSPGE